MVGILVGCHDRDRTHPYSPYPDLSTPIPSHLDYSRAPNTKPEPSDPLASQQRTPEHSDSLASSQRIPDPTHLQPFLSLTSSRFPTPTPIPDPTLIRPLLFLASSRFPTTTLIPDPTLLTFTPLRQIYSRCFIGLATAVGRSPIAYLPRSMRLSPSFLAPYIYVSSTFLCHITHYPLLVFYVSSSVPRLRLPLFHLSLSLTPVDPL